MQIPLHGFPLNLSLDTTSSSADQTTVTLETSVSSEEQLSGELTEQLEVIPEEESSPPVSSRTRSKTRN